MIRKILQSISSFPLVSGRTNEQFYSDMEAFVVHGANTTVNEQNQLRTEINNTVGDINDALDTISNNSNQIANDKITISQAVVNALAAKDAAIAAKDLASAIYDNFDDRYLDSHSIEPTVDNDGNALRSGALYYNSISSKMYVYDAIGLKWVDMMYIPTLLSSLSDVVFGSKANNDVIQYDSVSGKWVNRSFYSKAELDAFIDIHSKTAKTTLADTDEIMVANSATSWSLVKITWANIKTALTSLFIPKVTTSTTNAIPRLDSGGTLKNSGVIIDDSNNVVLNYSGTDAASFKQSNSNGTWYGRVIPFSSDGTMLFETQYAGNGGGFRFSIDGLLKAIINTAGDLIVPHTYLNTTASAANMFIDSTGKFFRSTSSKQYKKDIETIDKAYVDTFFDNARPIYYKSLSENDNPNWGYWGFVAEEIAEFDKRLVHWRYQTKDIKVEKERIIPAIEEIRNEKDEITQEAVEERIENYIEIEQVKDESKPLVAEGVMYERITVLLTAKVQAQQKIIDELIKRIEALEGAKQ